MTADDVRQIEQRLKALSWLRQAMAQHPGGIVPVSTAARVLGVSQARIRQIVKERGLTVLDDMPGGLRRDTFVPVDELIYLPFGAQRGGPGRYGPRNARYRTKISPADRITQVDD